MITQIGIIAGEIWNFLDKNKKARLSDIITGIDKSREVVLMSIGWLAREGHIVLEGEAPDYLMSLRKTQEDV